MLDPSLTLRALICPSTPQDSCIPIPFARPRSIVTAPAPAYNRAGGETVPAPRVEPTVMNVFLPRPRVSDLVFELYGRPLHPELFDILAVRKIQHNGADLTVRITRTGH